MTTIMDGVDLHKFNEWSQAPATLEACGICALIKRGPSIAFDDCLRCFKKSLTDKTERCKLDP